MEACKEDGCESHGGKCGKLRDAAKEWKIPNKGIVYTHNTSDVEDKQTLYT